MNHGMKIAGGFYKGRRIETRSPGLRPTSALVKKSLFDTLGEDIVAARFLDLFAGSGAVGLEALSRGADYVCFVEKDPSRVNLIRRNIASLGVPSHAVEIFATDYGLALQTLRERGTKFHVIYADPPYGEIIPRRILADIVSAGVLADDGVIIYEARRPEAKMIIHSAPEMLYPLRERGLGSTSLVFFRLAREHTP